MLSVISIEKRPLIQPKARFNQFIKAPELRVIGSKGENLGVLPFRVALEKAIAEGLDLIEISPNALPPVAKIMDYGKFQYDENKKQKAAKSRLHNVEIKSLQVKIGTGDHDLELKAKKASEWLTEGNRVKIDLYLSGRAKYFDFNFLKERLDRIMKLISVEFKVSQLPIKGPKGITTIIEKAAAK